MYIYISTQSSSGTIQSRWSNVTIHDPICRHSYFFPDSIPHRTHTATHVWWADKARCHTTPHTLQPKLRNIYAATHTLQHTHKPVVWVGKATWHSYTHATTHTLQHTLQHTRKLGRWAGEATVTLQCILQHTHCNTWLVSWRSHVTHCYTHTATHMLQHTDCNTHTTTHTLQHLADELAKPHVTLQHTHYNTYTATHTHCTKHTNLAGELAKPRVDIWVFIWVTVSCPNSSKSAPY